MQIISVIILDNKNGNIAPISPAMICVIEVAITPKKNNSSLLDFNFDE